MIYFSGSNWVTVIALARSLSRQIQNLGANNFGSPAYLLLLFPSLFLCWRIKSKSRKVQVRKPEIPEGDTFLCNKKICGASRKMKAASLWRKAAREVKSTRRLRFYKHSSAYINLQSWCKSLAAGAGNNKRVAGEGGGATSQLQCQQAVIKSSSVFRSKLCGNGCRTKPNSSRGKTHVADTKRRLSTDSTT